MVYEILYTFCKTPNLPVFCHKEWIKSMGDVGGASQLSWPSQIILQLIV